MQELKITVYPKGPKYVVVFNDELLCVARTPFFAAARALKERGYPDDAMLEMWHVGSDHFSLRARAGKAASLTVLENDRFGPRIAPYRPMPSGGVR